MPRVAPSIRFVPGNHDHRLWTNAREGRYLESIGQVPRAAALPQDPHGTHLLPSNERIPVRDRFVEFLAARADPDVAVTVEQAYPNLGLVSSSGQRAVVISHGHFIEPLYRAMSTVVQAFNEERASDGSSFHLEAENAGWIDFVWSSMGDSGELSRWARQIYESMQNQGAMRAEVGALGRAIAHRPGSRFRRSFEGLVAERVGRRVIRSLGRERYKPEVLSQPADEGLVAYLSDAVAMQVAQEVGRPEELSFVFGHTHKPFAGVRSASGIAGPITVLNTGGWVIDTPEVEPNKGASIILVDEDLNVAIVRCFAQGVGDRPMSVEGPPLHPSNPLVAVISSRLDSSRDPWNAFAEATAETEALRRRQLDQRLAAQTTGRAPGSVSVPVEENSP